MVSMYKNLGLRGIKTKPECSSHLPSVILVSETHASTLLIARCLQEMPKLGILPLTSKPQLCCQMINSKPSALVKEFFPCNLDFPSVCPMEIIAFRDGAEKVKKLNGPVMGIAVESHICHLVWINTAKKQGRLGPLGNRSLGVRSWVYHCSGLWSLKGRWKSIFRDLFIIDDKGTLHRITKRGPSCWLLCALDAEIRQSLPMHWNTRQRVPSWLEIPQW